MLFKLLSLLVAGLFTSFPSRGDDVQNLGILSRSLKPQSIQIIGDEIFVADGSSVTVYDLRDMRCNRQFGKEGEGPGEIKTFFFFINTLYSQGPGELLMEGFTKLLWLDLDGKPRREANKLARTFRLQPLGANFVGITFPYLDEKIGKTVCAVQVFDGKQKPLKSVTCQPEPMFDREGLFRVVPDFPQFAVHDNLLYIQNNENPGVTRIDIYDANGNRLRSLSRPAKPLAVDEAVRKKLLTELRLNFDQRKDLAITIPVTIQNWDDFLKWATLDYPKYLPSIRDFWIDRERIYVQSYEEKGSRSRFSVFTLKGDLLSELWLPVSGDPYWLGNRLRRTGARRSLVHQGQYYFLFDNEESEQWELHRVKACAPDEGSY